MYLFPSKSSSPSQTNAALASGKTSSQMAPMRVLAPADHFPVWFLELLKKESGREVTLTTYQDDAEIATVMAGEVIFDVVALTDRAIPGLLNQKKLAPLPADMLSHLLKPEAIFLHHFFDLTNTYVWPYACTYYDVAVRSDASVAPVKKWSDVFNPPHAAHVDFPRDPRLEWTLRALAQGQIGQRNKSVSVPDKNPEVAGSQNGEKTIRVDTVMRLKRLKVVNNAWAIVAPPPSEGSVIVLYHLALHAGGDPAVAAAFFKCLFSPAHAARLAEENYWQPTLKQSQNWLLSLPTFDKLVCPSTDYWDKCIFVRDER